VDAIDALGRAVDAKLSDCDVRLTMGGEPTFVSIDDMESAQWNTAALGSHKLERAQDLWKRLSERFAPTASSSPARASGIPGAVARVGRWASSGGPTAWRCGRTRHCWRMKAGLMGIPPPWRPNSPPRSPQARPVARARQPGYEDALHYLLKEAEIPDNLDPAKVDLKDPQERRSLAAKLSRGLDEPVGHVLPIAWDGVANVWKSSVWTFRRGRLYLLPGDSPMGLRLPLDSLPWVALQDRETPLPLDMFAPRAKLAEDYGEVARRYAEFQPAPNPHPEIKAQGVADSPEEVKVIHTALCVEARGGVLRIFMPPLSALEHYLELAAAIEAVARR